MVNLVQPRSSLAGIAAASWNALAGADHPFVSHAYLHALEASNSAVAETGWEAAHLLAEHDGALRAALPLYRKHHSWGEFVFDFAWADACHRAGLAYYPKFLTAVPFTPVAGPRLLGNDAETLIEAGLELMAAEDVLTWHVLFPDEAEHELWRAYGFLPRMDVRFIWRDRGFGDFDGFLAALNHKRRKEIGRERRRVKDAGIRFRTLTGHDLDDETLTALYRCYASTYHLRGRHPYLTAQFFRLLAGQLPETLVVFAAERDGEMIAAAICMRDHDTLYGRWWGALEDVPGLHFEACYYQGIAYCLEQGLTRYDPGTQGEHKLARGFAPEPAWSMHRLAHPGLEAAVRDALKHETALVQAYIDDCRAHLPYRRDTQ